MKILVISNYANGLILFRKEVITSFLTPENEVVISVPFDENCKKLEHLGVRLVYSRLERRGMNPIKDGRLLLEYLALLKKEKPDMVLTYTIKPNLYGGLAAYLLKIPYCMNITGLGTALENPGMLGKILLAFYKIVTQNASCVFFQNRGNLIFMQEHKIALKNSRLLPGSGINLKEHPYEKYPSEENGIRILAVLRIMKDKGIEEYLEAARILASKYPKLSFELVGEYEEESREKYEPLIQKLQQKGILKYYGHIDNVPEIMANSHILVHPSYHEGLSNVCLEAAACGRPILTTDIAGCRETVLTIPPANNHSTATSDHSAASDHSTASNYSAASNYSVASDSVLPASESGILFSAKSTDALVAALEIILSYTPQKREEMGIAGHNYVNSHFNRQFVIDAYHDAVNTVCSLPNS